MSIIISIVSQKGGVGKSTVTRALAREYASAGWQVKIADMDISQATSTNWNRRRQHFQMEPVLSVETYGDPSRALKAEGFDLIIFDGAPNSDRQTLTIAKASDLIIIPTGPALDDLEPSIKLGHELKGKGIDKKRVLFVLNGTSGSEAETEEAINYINEAMYRLAKGAIPERITIRRAQDEGKAATETSFPSVNRKVAEVIQDIVNTLDKLTN